MTSLSDSVSGSAGRTSTGPVGSSPAAPLPTATRLQVLASATNYPGSILVSLGRGSIMDEFGTDHEYLVEVGGRSAQPRPPS